jgi:mono/diheme cytochrome c family protein
MSTYQREQFPIPTPGRLRRELRLRRPPWWMIALLVLVVAATWVPLVLIQRARTTISREPRVHLVQDMDKQPRRGPQSAHLWFLDGRAMRLPVEGTVARGHLRHNEHLYQGYFSSGIDPASGSETLSFATTLPPEIPLTPALLERGRQRFAIYCALCHGDGGLGDGLIHQRAVELKETKWVPATNLMTANIRSRSDGQLFQAIRDGVRNMPAYGSQIDAHDRWAIVVWLRELQARSPVAAEEKKQ